MPRSCAAAGLADGFGYYGRAAVPLCKPLQSNARRLTDGMVANIVKHYALASGLDPAKYAGHSTALPEASAAVLEPSVLAFPVVDIAC